MDTELKSMGRGGMVVRMKVEPLRINWPTIGLSGNPRYGSGRLRCGQRSMYILSGKERNERRICMESLLWHDASWRI